MCTSVCLGMKMFIINYLSTDHAQINDLSQVPVPVMLLPDDFKASTKIKVNNHLFNKYCALLIGSTQLWLHDCRSLVLLPVNCTDFCSSQDLFLGVIVSAYQNIQTPLESNGVFLHQHYSYSNERSAILSRKRKNDVMG